MHERFESGAEVIEGDLLDLPPEMEGRFDVAMSFGTAEHFFGEQRQRAFDAHARSVRPGGLVVLWVPNRLGVLFHAGVAARRLLRRPTCPVDEEPFTHAQLRAHGSAAGLTGIQVKGSQTLANDFTLHIVDVPRLLGSGRYRLRFPGAAEAADTLRRRASGNRSRIRPWNDRFTKPLMLIGRKP